MPYSGPAVLSQLPQTLWTATVLRDHTSRPVDVVEWHLPPSDKDARLENDQAPGSWQRGGRSSEGLSSLRRSSAQAVSGWRLRYYVTPEPATLYRPDAKFSTDQRGVS